MRGWEKLGISRFRHAQVFLGFLVSRIAPQRFAKLDHGLGDLTLSEVHSAQIVVGNCEPGVCAYCGQVTSLRLLQIAFGEKGIRQTELGIRIIRLEPKNCSKLADVFITFAEFSEEGCVAVMCVC